MIKFLAELFRGFHYIIGISLPPSSTSDRSFVFAWLGAIAVIVAFPTVLFFIIFFLYFRQ